MPFYCDPNSDEYEAIPNSIRLVLVAKVTQKHPNTLNKMARI